MHTDRAAEPDRHREEPSRLETSRCPGGESKVSQRGRAQGCQWGSFPGLQGRAPRPGAGLLSLVLAPPPRGSQEAVELSGGISRALARSPQI